MATEKKDWTKEFAEAWGTTVKGLDKGTQLSIEWIDEKIVKPLEKEVEELKKKFDKQ